MAALSSSPGASAWRPRQWRCHSGPHGGPGRTGGLRPQVVEGVWTLPEHRGRQVDPLDATCLHRGADPSGRAFWMNALQVSLGETAVANAFLTSDEYLQAHRDLAAYLTELYVDVLGRSLDTAAPGCSI